jgi:hypothetical protein
VNITDGHGCNVWSDFTITQPTVLTASTVHQNLTIATVGSIDLTVNGGTLPYSYSWNNGATSADLTTAAPGFYEVGITDAHGCLVSTNVLVLDNQMSENQDV